MWTGEHGKSKLDASRLTCLACGPSGSNRTASYLGSLKREEFHRNDASAGAKYQVGPLPGAAAVIAGVSFPTIAPAATDSIHS